MDNKQGYEIVNDIWRNVLKKHIPAHCNYVELLADVKAINKKYNIPELTKILNLILDYYERIDNEQTK